MIKQLKPEDRKSQETIGERVTRIARKFLCEMAPDQHGMDVTLAHGDARMPGDSLNCEWVRIHLPKSSQKRMPKVV
jgi:hypothetical protein